MPKLHPIIIKNLTKLKYNQPTIIQSKTIPLSIKKKYLNNIIAASPTGSGKTLSFGIPILHNLLLLIGNNKRTTTTEEEEDLGIIALILALSRELVLQIQKEFLNVSSSN